MQGYCVLWLPEERLLQKGGRICDRPGGEEVLVWGCDSCDSSGVFDVIALKIPVLFSE